MPAVLAVVAQKGGVGKTTTATNLAAAIAGQYALRVLVIDLDPQRDSTKLLLGTAALPEQTIQEVLWEPRPAGDVMVPTPTCPDLFIVPGSRELARVEKDVSPAEWESIAQDARQTLIGGVPDDIDVVVIDTPPSLGLWMQCALASADGYLMIGEASVLGASALAELLETASVVAEHLNPGLRRLGIVVNNVRPTQVDASFVASYEEQFAGEVMARLPQRTQVKEAALVAVPIEFYGGAPSDVRAIYRDLASRVLVKLGVRRKARHTTGRGRGAPGGGGSADRPDGAVAPRNSARGTTGESRHALSGQGVARGEG